jgi:hypothetical protein
MVTHRRCRLLPLCGSQEVMDNPDANYHRFHDALDVVYRPGIDGQRLCYPRSIACSQLIYPNTGY